jgi:hypothetical protein
MQTWSTQPQPARPQRRVRHEVRDGLALVCSSLIVSAALAVALTIVTKLAG